MPWVGIKAQKQAKYLPVSKRIHSTPSSLSLGTCYFPENRIGVCMYSGVITRSAYQSINVLHHSPFHSLNTGMHACRELNLPQLSLSLTHPKRKAVWKARSISRSCPLAYTSLFLPSHSIHTTARKGNLAENIRRTAKRYILIYTIGIRKVNTRPVPLMKRGLLAFLLM